MIYSHFTLINDNDKQDLYSFHCKILTACTINRIALVSKYKGTINEIYRNQGRTTLVIPKHEIWIGNGGFSATKNGSNYHLYEPKGISSMQLKPQSNTIIFNLDYALDHPLLYFPELDSSENRFQDISANPYVEGDTLSGEITLFSSSNIKSIPRKLMAKNGAQSTIIWTEHADYADFRLHKACYYGSEKINSPSQSTGGFCKYNIPVKKSVFFHSHDTLTNFHYREKTEFKSLLASIVATPGYKDFLDSLDAKGHEICLHSPEFFTSNEGIMDTALQFITNHYHSPSWIDHG